MRLVVTGTREGRPDVWYWLDLFVQRRGVPELVILGGARGVDRQAREWCKKRGYAYVELLAKWEREDGTIDKAAGFKRNQEMVDLASPKEDWCLGFPLGKSTGTHDCMDRARRRGLLVSQCPRKQRGWGKGIAHR